MSDMNAAELHRFLDEWLDSGLPAKRVKPLADALALVARIDKEAHALAAESVAEAIAEIGEGKVPFGDGLTEVARRYRYRQPVGANNSTPLGEAVRMDARVIPLKAARAFLRTNGIALALESDGVAPGVRGWLETFADLEAAPERLAEEVPQVGYVMDPG